MLRPYERHQDLLPDFIKLAGGLQQIELGLLALEIGIQISQPAVVFLEASLLYFAHVDAAFGKLRLKHAHILLSELQLQAGDFLGGIALAQTAGLDPNGSTDFRFFVGESSFGYVEIDLGESDIGFGLSAEDGHLHLYTGVDIVALESFKELVVVVESPEQAVDANQLEGGVIAAFLASKAKLPGAHVRLRDLQRDVALHC